MNKIGIALLVGMGALLILAIAYAWKLWARMGNVDIGIHGWTAIILGTVFSLALGIGLMSLIFYSHRKGYDEIERD